MRHRPLRLAAALAAALVWSVMTAGIASANANLLRDGGFEWPALNGAFSHSYTAGDHIGAWRVRSGGVSVSTAFPGIEAPPAGTQVMNLRALPIPGPGDGRICQTVSGLVPGAMYKVRFQAASAIQDSTIAVTLGPVPVATVHLSGSVPARFTVFERHVTAPASSAPLCLGGHPIQGGAVPLVDAVRLELVS